MTKIPLARPLLGDEELAAVGRVLQSGRLSGGPEVARFEEKIAATCGRSHGVAVSSGTTALELAFQALGVRCGHRVLVTAFGFPSAANALGRIGAHPIAVDVHADTWLTDFDQALGLAEDAQGLVAIDQLGVATSSLAVEKFSSQTGLWVACDSACSIGSRDAAGKRGASAGLLATLSFHPRKPVTTGEGGAIVTDDVELSEKLLRLRNHGQSAPGVFDEFSTNARMSAVLAAIGSVQVERLQKTVAERSLLAEGYYERLAELETSQAISIHRPVQGAQSAHQSFALRLSEKFDRGAVVRKLREQGVESGPSTYAFPEVLLHRNSRSLPNAKALHERSLSLPLYCGMRSSELDAVAQALDNALT